MNDNWKQIETQFRSWIPRSPSPRLKEQLFPEEDSTDNGGAVLAAKWAWLAPVMGCFFVMMVLSGTRGAHLGYLASGPPTNWLAMVASNQSYTAYIVADFHSEQNALQNDPIELTNRPRASSRIGSLPLGNTNNLIR